MILKHNFYVVKLKRNFLPLIFLIFTFSLLLFSKSNLPAVKSGLALWANSVIPSLFPFFVATELLMHTNIITQLGNILNRYMKPLFNISSMFKVSLPLLFFIILFFLYFFVIYFYKFSYLLYHFS